MSILITEIQRLTTVVDIDGIENESKSA
jgi:hypothetical protein